MRFVMTARDIPLPAKESFPLSKEIQRSMDPPTAESAEILEEVLSQSMPALGIDIDGCVDEAPVFFQLLTKHWPGKVFVISYRSNREKAVADLAKHQIHYHELILVSSMQAKAEVIRLNGILVFFDDQPEVLKGISPSTQVMLVRNGGNFDFTDCRWMFSEETGKLV
jgi:hypothetical protein